MGHRSAVRSGLAVWRRIRKSNSFLVPVASRGNLDSVAGFAHLKRRQHSVAECGSLWRAE